MWNVEAVGWLREMLELVMHIRILIIFSINMRIRFFSAFSNTGFKWHGDNENIVKRWLSWNSSHKFWETPAFMHPKNEHFMHHSGSCSRVNTFQRYSKFNWFHLEESIKFNTCISLRLNIRTVPLRLNFVNNSKNFMPQFTFVCDALKRNYFSSNCILIIREECLKLHPKNDRFLLKLFSVTMVKPSIGHVLIQSKYFEHKLLCHAW